MRNALPLLLAAACLAGSACADDWPNWRGPAYNGTSPEKGLPATWSKTENIAWVAPLPGPAGATPVIFGDRIFLSSTDLQAKGMVAMCLNRRDGKVLWQKEVGKTRFYPRNVTSAAPSPVTDGKHAWFLYNDGTLVCFDLDGKQVWQRQLYETGDMAIQFGYTATPLLYKDRLIVPVLQNDKQVWAHFKNNPKAPRESFIVAFDPLTGKDVWRVPRTSDAVFESKESYTSPVPFERDGKSEFLVLGGDYLTSHDPLTGTEVWRWGTYNPKKDRMWRIVPTPVVADDLVLICPPKGPHPMAVKPGGGTLEKNPPAWTLEPNDVRPDVCVAAYSQGRLYVLDGDTRVLACVEPKTGKVLWKGEVSAQGVIRASPTVADGKVYCIGENGEAVVLSAGDKFEILAKIQMGEVVCQSTIVVAYGQLFLRTAQNLYCIGKK
jgi:outer membrane protein assembly factor BamB